MYKKQYQPNFKKFTPNKSRGSFKVRGPIKSFRDLDVYTKSTALSAEIFVLEISQDFGLVSLDKEIELLKDISKYIPKMIAESYGNRFDNFSVAERKLEKTAQVITSVISKIDFIISITKKVQEKKEKVSTESLEHENIKTLKQKQPLDRVAVARDGGREATAVSASRNEATPTDDQAVQETKEEIVEFKNRMEVLLKDYSIIRTKVLNLKRAWVRINQNFANKK